MKRLFLVLLLSGCSLSYNNEYKAAECFCKDRGGIKDLYRHLGLTCKDETHISNDFLIEKNICGVKK